MARYTNTPVNTQINSTDSTAPMTSVKTTPKGNLIGLQNTEIQLYLSNNGMHASLRTSVDLRRRNE